MEKYLLKDLDGVNSIEVYDMKCSLTPFLLYTSSLFILFIMYYYEKQNSYLKARRAIKRRTQNYWRTCIQGKK